MEKEKLISLWMAHGFLSSKGNMEVEDVGNEVWKELYLRSFYQEIEVKYGKTYFKMHDLIHDLATSLFSASSSSSNIRELNVRGYPDMSSVGFAKVVPSYSPSLSFKQFISLRVLNLRNVELNQLPSSIGDLLHLRYLDLSGNSMRSLPKRLCKLQNLQILDLHNCYALCCLPNQTSKLCSLQNLVLYNCDALTCMPARIGSLTCLKTLDWFTVGRKKGYQLGELKNLNLYGSISIMHLERVKNDKDAKEANLCAKGNLHSLSMSWDDDEPHRYESEEVKVLEALKPHPNLKSLEICGFRGFHLPNWINHSVLENVVSIKIEGCENCSCLPPFGELPCLESLELYKGSVKYVEEDIDVHAGFPRFPSLRKLIICDFCNLKGLVKKEGEEKFPVLEEMEIYQCPVFVFPTLSSVKTLQVFGADATSLRSISNLRALTSLRLYDNEEATSLPEEMFKRLANLKYLNISGFYNLKELPTSLASLNALKTLRISECDALECLPEALQHLTALTTLRIIECPGLENRCEEGIGEDWHKIAHIPNLNFEF